MGPWWIWGIKVGQDFQMQYKTTQPVMSNCSRKCNFYLCMICIATTGIDVWNPAFDITPNALITGVVVTELGVFQIPLNTAENLATLKKSRESISRSHCTSNTNNNGVQSSLLLLLDFFFISLLPFRCSAVKLRQQGPTFCTGVVICSLPSNCLFNQN